MDKKLLEFKLNQVIYEKIFDDNECEIVSKLYTNMEQAGSYDSEPYRIGKLTINSNERVETNGPRKSKGKMLSYDQCDWILEKIGNSVERLNKEYFNMPDMEINNIDILEYGISDEFKWHTDLGNIYPYSLRKISIVVFISDRSEYEGGQLEFLPNLKEPIKMEKGYMVAFPSHKLHRVAPITAGIRRTLVTWLYGKV